MKSHHDTIFVYHHLGLGDHFVCNGLIRYLLKHFSFKRLYLPTKSHNISTVHSMYSDDNRVLCLPVANDADVPSLIELTTNPRIIQVGFSKCRDDWDVSFYDSVGVDFSVRWEYFSVNRNLYSENTLKDSLGIKDGEPYSVVHDSGSVGHFPIRVNTNHKIIRIEKRTASLLDWCGVIEGAEEVHCVDSSVIHLAQCLKVKRGIFHNIRTKSTLFKLKNEWEVVDYAS